MARRTFVPPPGGWLVGIRRWALGVGGNPPGNRALELAVDFVTPCGKLLSVPAVWRDGLPLLFGGPAPAPHSYPRSTLTTETQRTRRGTEKGSFWRDETGPRSGAKD